MLNNEHILLATKFTQLLYRAMLHRARYFYCKSSVCPSVRNVEVSWSHWLEFFENDFTVRAMVFALHRP